MGSFNQAWILAVSICLSTFVVVLGNSSGNLIYCDIDGVQYGVGTKIMDWVQAPVEAPFYTFRTAETVSPTTDPTTYKPGELNPFYLSTLDLEKKFIGLVLYARNAAGQQVGSWEIPNGSMFWTPPTCKFKAVTHINADIKPMFSVFHFRAPLPGAGPLTFHILIKQGEQAKGNFYWPIGKTITLTEALANPLSAPRTIFKSAPRNSCNNACGAQGLACDEAATAALSSPDAIEKSIAGHYVCRYPIVAGCSSKAPTSGASDWCWYKSATCPSPQVATACSAMGDNAIDNQRLCQCKVGPVVTDVVPGDTTGQFVVESATLDGAPMSLTSGFTLNKLDLSKTGEVTVEFSAPSDKWVAFGWDAYFMEGAHATVWANKYNPQILPRWDTSLIVSSTKTGDFTRPYGWYDARCIGANNDWCRWTTTLAVDGGPYFTCALAGSTSYASSRAKYLDPDDPATPAGKGISKVACLNGAPLPPSTKEIRDLSLGDHNKGVFLDTKATVLSVSEVNGISTVRFKRPLTLPAPYYSFDMEKREIPLLWAIGDCLDFNYHAEHVSTITPLKAVLKQTLIPNSNYVPPAAKVDCVVSALTWSACSVTCGEGGTVTGTRTILTPPSGGGLPCLPLTVAAACPVQPPVCPGDCVVSAWSYGTCSVTCGPDGTRVATRTVVTAAVGGGQICPALQETVPCLPLPDCPVNCVMSLWSAYSTCSASCASGIQTRTRSVKTPAANGGTPCPTDPVTGLALVKETTVCNTEACPLPGDCVFSYTFGKCSVSCGNGVQTGTLAITKQPVNGGLACPTATSITQSCNNGPCPVDCVVSDFVYGTCSVSCGLGGVQTGTRTVITPAASGGKVCGSLTTSRVCPAGTFAEVCPGACSVSDFTYSACSVSCDTGTRTGTRTVITQPVGGGTPCPALTLTEPCYMPACPAVSSADCVGAWVPGTCSVTCGIGSRIETFTVSTFKGGNGAACDAAHLATRTTSCTAQACPGDCVSAYDYSKCSTSCGEGVETGTLKIITQPSNGGKACPTVTTLSRPCSSGPCPVDCVLSAFTYSACSVSCGIGGLQTGTRSVITKEVNGGKCVALTESIECVPVPPDCIVVGTPTPAPTPAPTPVVSPVPTPAPGTLPPCLATNQLLDDICCLRKDPSPACASCVCSPKSPTPIAPVPAPTPTPVPSSAPTTCADDSLICWDGSFVKRENFPVCTFAACKSNTSNPNTPTPVPVTGAPTPKAPTPFIMTDPVINAGARNSCMSWLLLCSMVVLSSVGSSAFSKAGRVSVTMVGLLVVAACMSQSVSAHNWLNSPSRAVLASVTTPCQVRLDNNPHLQVIPGQEFLVEWATGHGDSSTRSFYIIVVHADAYDKLADLNPATLEEYIRLAPPDKVTSLASGKYQKRHVSPLGSDRQCDVNEYEKIVDANHPLWVSRDPVMIAKSIRYKDTTTGFDIFEHKLVNKDSDVRVAYESRTFPYIESVSRFENNHHYSRESDISLFSIEAKQGPGDYIVHFYWGGYRDCMDVNVQPGPTPIAKPWGDVSGTTAEPRYAKIDHCEYRNILKARTTCRIMPKLADGSYDASVCMADCNKSSSCTAVSSIRYSDTRTPGTLPYTLGLPLTLWTEKLDADGNPVGDCAQYSIHHRRNCLDPDPLCSVATLKAAGLKEGDHVCFGLKPYRDSGNQVEEDYEVATDFRDPKFYNTCWQKFSSGGFLNIPPAKPRPVAWEFGSRTCINCEFRDKVFGMSPKAAPAWLEGCTKDCRQCDAPDRG